MKVIDYLKENFLEDKTNWILWLPVFFVCGIVIRFYCYRKVVIYFLFIAFLFQIIFVKKLKFLLPFIFLFIGVIRSDLYIKSFKNNFLTKETGYVNVEGYVEK